MFRPSRWLRNPHTQTILGACLREQQPPHRWAAYVPSPYGDLLRVDMSADPPGRCHRSLPTVLLLHGIAGSSNSAQVVTTWKAIQRSLGWRVAALNFRGADDRFPIPRLYHAGSSEDVEAVARHLLERFPGPLYVVGFSLGANVLLKWLGERGSDLDHRIPAACALSVPFHLGDCADRLEGSWLTRRYREHLVSVLKRRTERLRTFFPDCLREAPLRSISTLRQFDGHVTAPLHGFPDLETYYRSCSSAHYLEKIRRPVLILHAQDDPFYPVEDPPAFLDRWSSSFLHFELTPQGGHLGYVGSFLQFWFERRVIQFLAQWHPPDGA